MSFAEILDTHLGCTPVPAPAPTWSDRPLTTPLFAFELPGAAVRHTTQPRVTPALPLRLTPVERRTLDDARTPDALRHAYRALARRYHPDRHPDCTPAERQRLSRLFAEATEHYQRLASRV